MEWLSMRLWSPYVVGAGIGILGLFTFLVSDKPIGCSTAFALTSGMIERLFRGSTRRMIAVKKLQYFRSGSTSVVDIFYG